MENWPAHILYVSMRWMHLVATTLIVGGTLFFEFIVPLATESLKREQQLDVFGKARWVFRRVVWVSAALLVVSGGVTMARMWSGYQMPAYRSSFPWLIAHVGLGIVGLGIALLLTTPRRPPDHAVGWMRINLAILLIGIFTADVTRHIRITIREREAAMGREAFDQIKQPVYVPGYPDADDPTTRPATTRPTTPP
jgi:hypothetical protein